MSDNNEFLMIFFGAIKSPKVNHKVISTIPCRKAQVFHHNQQNQDLSSTIKYCLTDFSSKNEYSMPKVLKQAMISL